MPVFGHSGGAQLVPVQKRCVSHAPPVALARRCPPCRLSVRCPRAAGCGSRGSASHARDRNRGGLLEAAGLDFLAYGRGAGISNTVFWAGVILLLLGWAVLGRRHVLREGADGGKIVRTSMWAWVLPLIPAAPMLSRDVYSYLMQGAMLRDGFDPYTQGAAVNPGPFLLEVSHDWRNTTTPYGPLHLWIGEGVTRLVGDNVTAGVVVYKLISVAGFAAIAWAAALRKA